MVVRLRSGEVFIVNHSHLSFMGQNVCFVANYMVPAGDGVTMDQIIEFKSLRAGAQVIPISAIARIEEG